MAFRWLGRIAVFLLLTASLAAQEYDFSVYRQTRGLENLAIGDLAFDRSGFLWAGTENGVYRFLGNKFQRFGPEEGLRERQIQAVYAAPDGSVFVGTYQNLYRWTGNRFVQAGPKPISIWNYGHLVADGPGRLLLLDKNRLYRLTYDPAGNPLSYEAVLPDSVTRAAPDSLHLTAIYRDADGTVWIGCQYGICSWKDGKLRQYGTAEGLPKEVWYTILRDPRGSLWIAGEHKVMELPAGANRFLERTPPGGDPDSVSRRAPAALDRQGRLVISTAQGVARWENGAWRNFGSANGFKSGLLSALIFDTNGDAWLGSSGRGLFHWIGYSDWEGWTDNQGLPDSSIWSPGIFRGNYAYVGTEQGPAQIDLHADTVEKLFREKKWRFGQVSGMVFDGAGQILAGTFSGAVLRIDPQTRAVTQIATLPGLVFKIVRDSAGRIFIATAKGMYRMDSNQTQAHAQSVGRAIPERTPKLVSEVDRGFGGKSPGIVSGCVSPGGNSWFISEERVFGFQDGQWVFPAIAGASRPASALVDIACVADGSLWVTGMQSGSWHLTWRSGQWNATELRLPEEYRQLEPLAILSDSRGWLWIGTDNGVLVWNGLTGNGSSWRHLTRESGLVWDDINESRLTSGPDGSVWFGASGGLGHLLHPEHIFDPLALDAVITETRRGTQVLDSRNEFTLPWSNQSLAFQFATPLTLNRSELVFRYRIHELNADWTATHDTAAEFQALAPGRYTLEVIATNPARAATSAVVSSSFRILPPWWRSMWFYTLAALTLLGALWLLYLLRTRHLRNMKYQLEAQVRQRTLELESSREEMRLQATHDSLTGLLNRGAILAVLNAEIERSFRERTPVAIVLADIDFFKRVNDTWGHLAGDAVLRRFAASLREGIRNYDSAGRYGGEEFLLILPGVVPSEVEDRLHQLHQAVSGFAVSYAGAEIRVNCCMGAVLSTPNDCSGAHISADVALAAADLALYRAKQTGRNRVVLHSRTSPEPTLDRQPQPSI